MQFCTCQKTYLVTVRFSKWLDFSYEYLYVSYGWLKLTQTFKELIKQKQVVFHLPKSLNPCDWKRKNKPLKVVWSVSVWAVWNWQLVFWTFKRLKKLLPMNGVSWVRSEQCASSLRQLCMHPTVTTSRGFSSNFNKIELNCVLSCTSRTGVRHSSICTQITSTVVCSLPGLDTE